MAVGMAGKDIDPPAVDVVARVEQSIRLLHPVHGRHELVRLGDDPLDRRARHPVQRPVVGEPLGVPLAPRPHALRVVDPPLEHGRTRQLGHVTCAADVVRVHVRDHDCLDRAVEGVDHRAPASLGVA